MSKVFTQIGILASITLALGFGPQGANAWDGSGGTLAAIPWSGPQAAALEPLHKECWLLVTGEDMAVVLLPPGYAPPGSLGALRTLEPLATGEGHYYLFYVRDATGAKFSGDVRVLLRQGHTVLLWSGDGVPQLTRESRPSMGGLQQPVRITVSPKAWPADLAGAPLLRTEFHPLVDVIVADVELTEYVNVWQALDDYETRYVYTTQNENSALWMYDVFESYGLQAEFHEYNQSGIRKNVIGTLPGLVSPEMVVYITGHFDSISEDPENHAPGADDNGSGTAAFLEAARVLSQYAFHYTIRFVGFNGEEQGLVGSAAYCNYIAGLEEEVVGCYNFDMIAYAGVDPAPPDLIIYTNSASLPLAQILHDACLEYVPDDVEPFILEEALGASDHASFWNHGWQAILGIEEEAWGSDFCPWYHTSNDRIENYPQDYPTNVTKAGIAAVAQTAMPLQPDMPYLLLEAMVVDDDDSGASQGNGNGIPEYGETIELTLTLENVGQQDGIDVQGQLQIDDEHITLIADEASFGTIPADGGLGQNLTPFIFTLSPRIPDGHAIDFTLAISEAPDNLGVELVASAPAVTVVAFDLDDSVGGNGDGIPQPGEEIVLDISLKNDGSATVSDVWGTLLGGAYVTAEPTPQEFGDLASGAAATAGPFTVSIDPDCPPLYSSTLYLQIEGSNDYAVTDAFLFNIGDIFWDDMETGAPSWSHYAGDTGFSDEWHLETHRNHTYGGATSWKCGGAGGSDYGNLLYAVLETSPFTLPPGSRVTFWHWMHAEVSGTYQDYCYDGGLVEISVGGGPWETITPDGGYPYRVREGGTPGPFPAETPVFSGEHDWQQEWFDLSGYTGSARLRFAFGSDGAGTEEGWYVDDIMLVLEVSGAEDELLARTLHLLPARNPSMGASALRLDLPARARVRAEVFDATGRRLQTLVDETLPGGRHDLRWDGRDASGRPAGAGIYWVVVTAADRQETARLVIVR